MKKIQKFILGAGLLLFTPACTDLYVIPKSTINSEVFYTDGESYFQYLTKIYAGLAISGQIGPNGSPDIAGIDEGFSSYLRQYWKAQELTTDEAVIGWNDGTLQNYHTHTWSSGGEFISAMYNRIFYQIALCNDFLKESTDEKMTLRGNSSDLKTTVKRYRAEARFMRALSYWHGLDMFGPNIPYVTDGMSFSGTETPSPATGTQLFDFIETELLSIIDDLADADAPKSTYYGRATKGAAWTLLAKLYLNAKVYTGTDMSSECITFCNKVISSGAYSLSSNYRNLFKADNNTSGEMIFTINFGNNTRNWGGMTFILHAAIGGSMNPADYGSDGAWWGLRCTKNLPNLFTDVTGATDTRAIFYTSGQNLEINDIGSFTDGYAVPKFVNIKSDGGAAANNGWPDTDFPVFRLGDVYLMYAEAVLRGGSGGSTSTAVDYINLLRERAYGNTNGDITSTDLTLSFILDERGRELYWEGHRRTDLVRFNQFTENGIWPWKGGVAAGKVTDSYRNIFPIPSTDLIANTKLKQNTGY